MTTRETELLTANAALELEVARLRSVMADVIKAHGYVGGTPTEVLSTPFTPTALNELIEEVEKMTIERCALEVDKSWFKDPCFINTITNDIRTLPTGNMKLEKLL